MFVKVVLDLPVDQSFTYRVGNLVSHSPAVGKRVIVPFGPRDRLTTGVVVNLLEEPDVPEEKVKEVFDFPDDFPLFSETDLELLRWVSEYYCSSFGETVFRFLPGAFRVEESVEVRLTGGEFGSLTEKERAVVELLSSSSRKKLKVSTLRRRSGLGNLNYLLKKLSKKGVVELLPSFKADSVPRSYYLVEGEGDCKGKKSLELISLVRERGRIPLEEARSLGFSSQVINRLLNRGCLRLVEEKTTLPERKHSLKDARQVKLTPEQVKVLEGITSNSGISLLYGVTGSGKMEVYLHAAKRVVDAGKGVLILVPELLLTPELKARVEAYFGEVVTYHGKLTDREKASAWIKALKGEGKVFIGTRGAVLLPVKDLGLIIVDEEHDASYKEQQKPYYNARDVAVKRGEFLNIPVLLVSATPSVDSYHMVKAGKVKSFKLEKRVSLLPPPKVELVDMRKEKRVGIFSEKLLSALEETVSSGQQALLYINRRGFYSQAFCPSCGFVLKCRDCDVSLAYHRSLKLFICHVCGKRYKPLYRCPKCGTRLELKGYGTERVEEEVKSLFPKVRVVRLDVDSVKDPLEGAKVISQIKRGEVDVIVGTNIAIKGHNFPKLALVGILNADLLSLAPDYKASERVFQSIVHAVGRAGRFRPGFAVVQTYNPETPAVKYAIGYQVESFLEEELLFRELSGYPPWKKAVLLEFLLKDKDALGILREAFKKFSAYVSSYFKVSKLVPAPISKVAGNYRYHSLLLTSPEDFLIKTSLLKRAVSKFLSIGSLRCKIVVDPTRIL